jgi:type VI secretion system FHA domain protein
VLLALSVISAQGAGLGASAYKVFDERGGSIGRIESNDWSLPDPERFVSSRHAVVRFEGGAFCLEDVSTNGTFINGPDQPVSKREPVRLKDGDRLFIGDYEIMVQLIEESMPSSQPAAVAIQAPAPPVSAALGTDDPLAVIGIGAGSAGPACAPAVAVPARAPAPGASVGPAPSAASLAAGPPERSAAPAAAPDPAAVGGPRPPGAATAAGLEAGARDLLTMLGLEARDVPADIAGQLGAIIRTVVQGMIEVLRARAEVKSNFRTPMTSIRPLENNPLKFSLDADDALHNLFVKRNPGYLGPVEAFREGFQDIAFHELAMLAAMRTAYQSMVAKFSPANLEEAYASKLRRTSVLPIGGRLKLWEMYCAQFGDIEKDSEASFQLLFGEEFAKAYHKQLERLSQAAKLHKKQTGE